jgi:hypothetical protein
VQISLLMLSESPVFAVLILKLNVLEPTLFLAFFQTNVLARFKPVAQFCLL